MRLPSPLIERKVGFAKIITDGFNSAANEKLATIDALTSLTAESVMAKSKYQSDSAQTFAFSFGYLLGVLSKVAILSAKETK